MIIVFKFDYENRGILIVLMTNHSLSTMELVYGSKISENLNSVLGLKYNDSPCDGYPDHVSYNREDIENLSENGCEIDGIDEDEYNDWYDRLQVEIWEHERENRIEGINIWYKYEDDCGDNFCVECNVNLGESNREYCPMCNTEELEIKEECLGCELGTECENAHILDGVYHPNCIRKKEEPAFWMILNGTMDSMGEVINRCIGCGVDMGICNPRQYCMKTYCAELE